MAHFNYPLRRATSPEDWAFAYPERERGVLKPHHDRWGIDLGARLVAKVPFYVGEYLVGLYEEFVVIDKKKGENRMFFRSVRNGQVTLEASAAEIDARFYVVPGEERPIKSSYAQELLGKPPKVGSGKKIARASKK